MARYDTFVTAAAVNEHDIFRRTHGRALPKPTIRTAILLALLLYQRTSSSSKKQVSSPLRRQLEIAAEHWSCFFDTWPDDFLDLPLFWEEQEMDRIKGTSYHARVSRMRQEMPQIWEMAVEPAFSKANIFTGDSSSCADGENDDLRTVARGCFERALGAVNSRSHASGRDDQMDVLQNTRSLLADGGAVQRPQPMLCPLQDLVNGARDEDCNTEVSAFYDDKLVAKYILRAIKPIKAGEELIVSYSDVPNMDYFAKFGFVPLRQGQPVLHKYDFVRLQTPPGLIPDTSDSLRWKALHKYGLTIDRLTDTNYWSQPFSLTGSDASMRQCRRKKHNELTKDPHIFKLYDYVSVLLTNEKGLREMPQPPFLEVWELAKMIIEILEYNMGTLLDSSNLIDLILLERETGNKRTALLVRILERELFLKWRHAIGLPDYVFGSVESNMTEVPDTGSIGCCDRCKSSFRLTRCSKCKFVVYCGRDCQIEGWKAEHKEMCKDFRGEMMKTNPELFQS